MALEIEQRRSAVRRRNLAALAWVLTHVGGVAYGAGVMSDGEAQPALMVAGGLVTVTGGYLIRKATR